VLDQRAQTANGIHYISRKSIAVGNAQVIVDNESLIPRAPWRSPICGRESSYQYQNAPPRIVEQAMMSGDIAEIGVRQRLAGQQHNKGCSPGEVLI